MLTHKNWIKKLFSLLVCFVEMQPMALKCVPWNESKQKLYSSASFSSSSSSFLEFHFLSLFWRGPFHFYRNSNSLNGWFQMAVCECFELTLLICERVCGPERNGRPLRHMGSRFTPPPFKDTSKPRWPLARSLLCCPGRETVVVSPAHILT